MFPKKVLDLFPIWEYRCPSCGTYVESSITFCPYCKTQFCALKWRVPPRFLKSKKAMSEYAHKVLAPKLTERQRALLFRYFTVVFSDNFEDGTLNAWTGTVGSPTVVSTQKHHGTYSVELDGVEYPYKTFTGGSPIYCRCYVRFTNLPSVNGNQLEILVLDDGTGVGYLTSGATIQIFNDAGTVKWRMYANTQEAGWENVVWASTPSTGVWYAVELKWQRNTVGGAEFWVNGTSRGTCINTTQDHNIAQLLCGAKDNDEPNTEHIDCVVVADAYIGLEVTAPAGGSVVSLAMEAIGVMFIPLSKRFPKFVQRVVI